MNIANTSTSALNNYAITASALCEIAYLNTHDVVIPQNIINAVAGANKINYNPKVFNPTNPALTPPQTMLPVTVVWGPAYLPLTARDTDSLMYIAQVTGSNEYFVVVRGTNPESVKSWTLEDFAVNVVEPINTLPGWPAGVNPGSDCYISQGAFNGVSDLISLVEQETTPNQTAVQFLQEVLKADSSAYIYITGHSLGGTLAPVLFAYLNAVLFAGNINSNMAMWSFAGLTAGGSVFNNYINTFTATGTAINWRNQNSLDVAPLLFQPYINNTLPANIINLFSGVPIDTCASDVLTDLFKKANATTAKHNQMPPGEGFYVQSDGYSCPITGTFQIFKHIPGLATWAQEAFYQHHSSTYYQMVFEKYTG